MGLSQEDLLIDVVVDRVRSFICGQIARVEISPRFDYPIHRAGIDDDLVPRAREQEHSETEQKTADHYKSGQGSIGP